MNTTVFHVPHPAILIQLAEANAPIEVLHDDGQVSAGVLRFHYVVGNTTYFIYQVGDMARATVFDAKRQIRFEKLKKVDEAVVHRVQMVASITGRPRPGLQATSFMHELISHNVNLADIVPPMMAPDLFMILCSRMVRFAILYGIDGKVQTYGQLLSEGTSLPYDSIVELECAHAKLALIADGEVAVEIENEHINLVLNSLAPAQLAKHMAICLISEFTANSITKLCARVRADLAAKSAEKTQVTATAAVVSEKTLPFVKSEA